MNATSMPASRLAIHSIDHFALVVPELAEAAEFFSAFGLEVTRSDDQLLLRAADGKHVWGTVSAGAFKHLGYLCLGCYEEDFDGLVAQASAAGARPALRHPKARYPDGAWFNDPDGNLVQLRVGAKTTPDRRGHEPPPPRASADRGVLNRASSHRVVPTRLSHILLFAGDVDGQVQFYEQAFGFGLADKSEGNIAFMYGRHGSDHHLLAFARSHGRGWHHASWDVPTYEDIGLGWMQMQAAGFARVWGPGRHVLGSNYFCYVQDPWGSFCEYSAHIDFVPEGYAWPAGDYPAEDSLYLWGPVPLSNFITNTENYAAAGVQADERSSSMDEISPAQKEGV